MYLCVHGRENIILNVELFSYEKIVPRRATKFHRKIVKYLNVCNWDLDFQIFISLNFLN